ncbi:myosin heavy chain, striated muscle-like [Branchiostoma floridae x Branchiostoma belcheri]
MQARALGKSARKKYMKLYGSRAAVGTLQRNIRAWFRLRNDWWIRMYQALQPRLTGGMAEELLKETKIKLAVQLFVSHY